MSSMFLQNFWENYARKYIQIPNLIKFVIPSQEWFNQRMFYCVYKQNIEVLPILAIKNINM